MKTYEELADEFGQLMYESNPRERLLLALNWLENLTADYTEVIEEHWGED